MKSAPTGFDAVEFFLSPDGRLNRLPYNTLLIIVIVLDLIISVILDATPKNVRSTPVSNVERNLINLCIERSKNANTPGRDVSKDLEKCKEAVTKSFKPKPRSSMILLLLSIFLGLFLICPTIKRLHDRDKSGWLYLGFIIASFIPLINLIVTIWLMIETSFLRGTVGPNDYGRDPLSY